MNIAKRLRRVPPSVLRPASSNASPRKVGVLCATPVLDFLIGTCSGRSTYPRMPCSRVVSASPQALTLIPACDRSSSDVDSNCPTFDGDKGSGNEDSD